jgi:transposase-like protein
MKRNCPNLNCDYYQKNDFIIKDGKYKRVSDSKTIQRFRCKNCKKKFSASTGTLEYNQKKRRINSPLFKLISSGISQRRAALILGVHRKTIIRKFQYLGEKSRVKNKKLQEKLKKKVTHMQFDDLVTKECSKLKPLSVSIAVDANQRYILGAKVSSLRAFGHLAKKGRERYPDRKNTHKEGLFNLFEQVKSLVDENALIRSDEHKFYPEFVQRYFPSAKHETFKSERGCIAGQGELKKVNFDPLFAINHTCAMLRANLNRLVRKTWCTTKDPERLQDHLDIFISFYNFYYLKSAP